MGINVKNPLLIGGIKTNYNFSPYRVGFGNNNNADSFQTTSVNQYMTENSIKNAITTNPNIKNILKEKNIPVKLNLKELETLSKTHLKDTQDISAGVINNLPLNLKQFVNIKNIKDAAYLHDIGKTLIPDEILNKSGELTAKEREIMDMHSELGYELLKNTNLDPQTLKLIKYHHQNPSHNGYPKVPNDFFADINLQILTCADKYSALTENRCYRKGLEQNQALAILYKDVKTGDLHPFVFKALVNYLNSNQPTTKPVTKAI